MKKKYSNKCLPPAEFIDEKQDKLLMNTIYDHEIKDVFSYSWSIHQLQV